MGKSMSRPPSYFHSPARSRSTLQMAEQFGVSSEHSNVGSDRSVPICWHMGLLGCIKHGLLILYRFSRPPRRRRMTPHLLPLYDLIIFHRWKHTAWSCCGWCHRLLYTWPFVFPKIGNSGGSRLEVEAGSVPSDRAIPGLLPVPGHLQHSGGFYSNIPETKGKCTWLQWPCWTQKGRGIWLTVQKLLSCQNNNNNSPPCKLFLLPAEYLWLRPHCPKIFYYCPCMTNSSLASG